MSKNITFKDYQEVCKYRYKHRGEYFCERKKAYGWYPAQYCNEKKKCPFFENIRSKT